MIPVVTPTEMGAIDAAAPEPVEVLIERAGAAVARAAVALLGGTYGRLVIVVCGKGNNGNDGRAAARRLRARGAAVRVVDAAECPAELSGADLVIDAAYGTGLRGAWIAPGVGGARVLAVDIPSGLDGLTGLASGRVLAAERTVTFAASKPGLLFGDGPDHAGAVEIADIGLDMSGARTHVVEASDVAAWWRPRPSTHHKWNAAVRVVAASAGMQGAGYLAAGAAQRSGAGMVQLMTPVSPPAAPLEAVTHVLGADDWSPDALGGLHRFGAMAIGPGLGRQTTTTAAIRATAAAAPVPIVVDGDGLFALSEVAGLADMLTSRSQPTVLTPHDGEYALLTGHPPGSDRIDAALRLARETRSIVLLKGPTTVVASSSGAARLIDRGDRRLATAGSGDVLTGVIAALLASGLTAFDAAAAGAWLHGDAAARGHRHGLVAGDLLGLLPAAFAGVAP